MAIDFRGKRVRWTHDPSILGSEDLTDKDRAHDGQCGIASSIYTDGRPATEYMLKFDDGHETNVCDSELTLAE